MSILKADLAHQTTKLSDKQLSSNREETSLAQRENSSNPSLNDEELVLSARIPLKNVTPSAHESIPHPDSLHPLKWIGRAYLVTVGRKVGIFKTW